MRCAAEGEDECRGEGRTRDMEQALTREKAMTLAQLIKWWLSLLRWNLRHGIQPACAVFFVSYSPGSPTSKITLSVRGMDSVSGAELVTRAVAEHIEFLRRGKS